MKHFKHFIIGLLLAAALTAALPCGSITAYADQKEETAYPNPPSRPHPHSLQPGTELASL